jgi:hypothetical protein
MRPSGMSVSHICFISSLGFSVTPPPINVP